MITTLLLQIVPSSSLYCVYRHDIKLTQALLVFKIFQSPEVEIFFFGEAEGQRFQKVTLLAVSFFVQSSAIKYALLTITN